MSFLLIPLYIVGIFISMPINLRLYKRFSGDEWAVPGGWLFQAMCWFWPMSYCYFGGGMSASEVLDWYEKRNQLPPEPPKDKYLLEAEKEVDAFLGYSDVPEVETVQSFDAMFPHTKQVVEKINPYKRLPYDERMAKKIYERDSRRKRDCYKYYLTNYADGYPKYYDNTKSTYTSTYDGY